MTITINTLKRRPGGRESIRARAHEAQEITIGRDAASDLVIPDLNISLNHATLAIDDNGEPVFSLLPGCNAQIDGRLTTGKTKSLKPDSKIGLGRYELRIEPSDAPDKNNSGNVTATLEQMEAAPAPISAEDENKIFGLHSVLPSKRLMAWVFSLAVIGFFLALPIWSHLNAGNDRVKSLPVQADLSWNSGEISLMHVNLKNDCKACHVKAFVSVEDKACVDCHKTLRDHAKPEDLRATRPQPTGFGAKLDEISNMFGRPPERCAACHVEHNSRAKIIETDQNMCADCHKDLSKHLKDTKLAAVSDFGTNHPEFSPNVITEPSFTNPVFTRLSLDKNPRGFSGLKFPHDVHLTKGEAVAKMARKLGDRYGFADGVDCADCHRPEAGDALFEPVSMVQDCAMCHDIGFEDDDGYLRTLRHGEPKEVIASMRDFYQAKALGNIRDAEMNSRTRRRPGKAAQIRDLNRRELAFKQADTRTAAKVKSIFSKGGACADCHVIDMPTDPATLDYHVRPISLNDSFYPKSPFNHKSHEVGKLTCKSCHAAETSKLSSDILLPKIEICRDCHIGEDSYKRGGKFAAGTLPTTCLTCHTYHGGPHADLMGKQEQE